MAAITAEGLERNFGDLRAVDGVDLDIAEGEIYGFLGPNGAGKSTTVRVLTTLITPSSGRAIVAGYDVAKDPEAVRLRIGVALQEAALDPKQTGREQLDLQARLYGLPAGDRKRRVAEMVELVGIGDAIDRRVGTYSGGMARRLDLATALVHRPQVLFLDEPTTGLDPVSRARVWAEVRRLNEQDGLTIFLTTQYLQEADELAGRVGIIAGGRLVAEGTPEELKRRIGSDVVVADVSGECSIAVAAAWTVQGVHAVEVHGGQITVSVEDGSATVGPLAVAFQQAGVVTRTLTLRSPTLDDVFLEITGAHLGTNDAAEGAA